MPGCQRLSMTSLVLIAAPLHVGGVTDYIPPGPVGFDPDAVCHQLTDAHQTRPPPRPVQWMWMRPLSRGASHAEKHAKQHTQIPRIPDQHDCCNA